MPGGLQMQGGQPAGARRDGGTWTAFLIIAFGVLGLVGAFGTYAAQIPFERALARSAALDEALAGANAPDEAARLEALRPALDDSAEAIISRPGPMADKVAAERVRMLNAFGREARDIGVRLRLVIAVFTAACAVFGVAVLSIVRRAA
jgi:hypothetical protein